MDDKRADEIYDQFLSNPAAGISAILEEMKKPTPDEMLWTRKLRTNCAGCRHSSRMTNPFGFCAACWAGLKPEKRAAFFGRDIEVVEHSVREIETVHEVKSETIDNTVHHHHTVHHPVPDARKLVIIAAVAGSLASAVITLASLWFFTGSP